MLHVVTCTIELTNDVIWLNFFIFISLCALFGNVGFQLYHYIPYVYYICTLYMYIIWQCRIYIILIIAKHVKYPWKKILILCWQCHIEICKFADAAICGVRLHECHHQMYLKIFYYKNVPPAFLMSLTGNHINIRKDFLRKVSLCKMSNCNCLLSCI